MRERDFRNGMKELLGDKPLAKLPFLPQFLARPGWLASFLLDGGVPKLPNIVVPGQGPLPLIDVGSALSSAAVTWEDLRWIREAWSGPVVIKGVLTADDARRALDEGASAIVVSNHGGRQLDGVPASLRVLPEIVAAVNGRAEVLMDGGVRRGSDIVKAIWSTRRADRPSVRLRPCRGRASWGRTRTGNFADRCGTDTQAPRLRINRLT
jgi:L-lactate dehydrogenase (cytochrome)